MKLTDEEIKNEVRSIVMAGLNNPASQKTLTGFAKWARDKACEWVPVSRELPELTDFSEPFIEQSDRLLLLLKNGDMIVGYFTVDRGENDSFFEDGAERFDFDQVIGWQHAPQPPKSE